MLEHAFRPADIGDLTVPNRFVMPPMGTRYASEDGYATDQTVAYYRERAAGGTGLLIFESTYPSVEHPGRHLLVDDSYTENLGSVVEAVHGEDGTIAVQLNLHRGFKDEVAPKAPSELTVDGETVPAIDTDEIGTLVDRFAEGAKRARRAGFDGIEIHAAHGYLLSEFLSPYTNTRTDEYGGSLENRTRLARELLDGIREEVGREFPVWFRIQGHEYVDGGIDVDEAKRIAATLVEAGSDAIHVTAGYPYTGKAIRPAGQEATGDPYDVPQIIPSGRTERGVYADLAAEIKASVDVPVIVVGRINDPHGAEDILAAGKADLVAMGRAHLADPHFVSKAEHGEFDRIRRCVGGMEGCREMSANNLTCTVNAALGDEATNGGVDEQNTTAESLDVLVVGGGPAGMEAARVSADRGHSVTLVERDDELGGQLRWARHAPAKDDYDHLVTYFERALSDLDVDVRLGCELSPGEVAEKDADEVVVAVGAGPEVPNVEGAAQGVQSGFVTSARAILSSSPPDVDESIVIAGGSETAFDVADYLSEHDTSSTIVPDGDVLPLRGGGRPPTVRTSILERTRSNPHVDLLDDRSLSKISEGAVTVRGSGTDRTLDCDAVVLAESAPNVAFQQVVEDDDSVHQVGDANGIQGLYAAIHGGNELGKRFPLVR